ncbi:Site-specific recombinase XerD [Salinimicrobium catena]|uniref:Site-specific recombinase XerD n=1 Tax=Salinimicrobium catena TaxID=390640 RepID=A0A1H5JQM6_9FLAO|nr:site-specific integrase [Salinimicrobium catena]SDL83825.1 Site-specific recombinase XerD [Salinimicrobium catena]SEE53958.1 Site-specific recombinase XerD [Salinimicrobium catena]
MKTLFLIKKQKVNKAGLTPVMCRITYEKSRKQFSTGLFINPDYWSKEKQKVIESTENSEYINTQLSLIKQKLGQAFLLLQIQQKNFDVEDVLKSYNGEEIKKEYGVLSAYKEHNDYYQKLIGKDIKEVSWQKFENTKGHLQEFIKWKFQQRDIKLNKLKYQFIKDFEYYLRTEKEMQQSTINKTLQRFKKMINFAVAQDYLDKNPFLMHKPKPAKKEVVYLTKTELSRLQEKELGNKRLEEVRDCFVFCCYTGLAFKEMTNLRKNHIVQGEDGRNWIKMKRQKTGKSISIPLLPVAQKVLEKYDGILIQGKILPSKTNAHFNAYLKEIADLCDIKINLTHHIARKTFATTVLLLNDVPMEVVSKLLGHSRITITQAHYGQILQEKVVSEVDKLMEKL